jgi:hypothetical protein
MGKIDRHAPLMIGIVSTHHLPSIVVTILALLRLYSDLPKEYVKVLSHLNFTSCESSNLNNRAIL